MTDAMKREETDAILKGHDADYIELRLDDTASNRIVYRGQELEEIGRTRAFGGNVRALVNGGWGFVSFNEPTGLKDRVAEAVSQARHVGGEGSRLATLEPVVDTVPLRLVKDPREISLAAKKEIMDRYNGIMLSVPGVTSTNIVYRDEHKRVVFASSEGAYIEQERLDVVSRLAATARKNGDMQQSSMSLGSLGDFTYIEGMDDTAKEIGEKAVELLAAPYANIRERPDEGDHGAGQRVRAEAPEHRRRGVGARLAGQLQIRR
jgi:TldD protein